MENNFDIHEWQAKFLKENDGLDYDLDNEVNQKLLSKMVILFDQIHTDLDRKGIEIGPDELAEYLADQMKIYSYGG